MISVVFQNTLDKCDFKYVLAGLSFHFRREHYSTGQLLQDYSQMCPLIPEVL